MRVFLSWSGDRSKELARALDEWLPRVLPLIKTSMSETIPVGTEWRTILMKRLRKCDATIACLTPENLRSQWLNFEAGAAASMADYRLFPVFLGKEALPAGPLSGLQVMRCSQNDLGHLVSKINSLCEPKCPPQWVNQQFDLLWRDLEKKLDEATSTWVDYDEAIDSVREHLEDLKRLKDVDVITFYVRDYAAPKEAPDYYIEAASGLRDPAPMYGPVVADDFRKEVVDETGRFSIIPKEEMRGKWTQQVAGRARSFIGREKILASATFRATDNLDGEVKALLNLNWRSEQTFTDEQKNELREYADAVFALLPRKPAISLERARLLTKELRARRHLDAAQPETPLCDKIRGTLEQFFQSESPGLDIDILLNEEMDATTDPNVTWVRETTKPLYLEVSGEPSRIVVPVPPGLKTCKGIIVISERLDGLHTLNEDMVRPLCSLADTFGGI